MSEREGGKKLILPESLISSIDLSRLVRELTALDDSLYQANVRQPGAEIKLARSSQILEDMAAANDVSLTDATQRGNLLTLLKLFTSHAPLIHISFAVEPSAKVTNRLIIWLRQNIHPYILLETGLQPLLSVGCMVRTNNQVFDMSLRHRFREQRSVLLQRIARTDAPAPEAELPPAEPKEVAAA